MEVICDNIKKEPEVHFVLILPPAEPEQMKSIGKIQDDSTVKLRKFDPKRSTNIRIKHSEEHQENFDCSQIQFVGRATANLQGHTRKKKHKFVADASSDNPILKVKKFNARWKKTKLKMFQIYDVCKRCNFVGSRSDSMIKHLIGAKCSSVETFHCDLCESYFTTKVLMERHIGKHIKKKYSCDFCKRDYKCKRNLDRHHRPKSCQECNEEFLCKTSLILHMEALGHFKCQSCSFLGASQQHLVKHWNKMHRRNFSCETCSKSFPAKYHLKYHQMYHKHGVYTDRPYMKFECNECEKCFKTPFHLKRHKKMTHAHRSIDFQCDHCSFKSKLKPSLNKHLLIHTGKFSCEKCHQTFSTHRYLKKHMSSKKIYKCSRCKDEFKCKLLLIRHYELHSNTFKCDRCPYIELTKRKLFNHSFIHSEKFKCETCGKSFGRNTKLEAHQMYHKHGVYADGPDIKFECNECEKFFKTPFHLKDHKRMTHMSHTHHTDDFQCDHCSFRSKFKRSLHRHLHLHTGKFSCEKCHKNFANHQSLKKHMSSKKIYKCSRCQEEFKCKLLLIRHYELHSNTFKCDRCPYIELTKSKLLNHSFIHSEKFKCETCGKCVYKKSKLETHQMYYKHGVYADRPDMKFECNECGKFFKTPFHLKDHKYKSKCHAHLSKDFQCDHCSFRSKFKRSIRRHVLNHLKRSSFNKSFINHVELQKRQCPDESHEQHEPLLNRNNGFDSNKCGQCPFIGMTTPKLHQHFPGLYERLSSLMKTSNN